VKPIKVVIHGALGKIGRTVTAGLCRHSELEIVGAVEKEVTQDYLQLPDGSKTVPFSSNLETLLTRYHPEVLVDFTIAEASMAAARIATKHKVNLVIGTTGLSSQDLSEIEQLTKANNVGAVVVPNFALGAVVLLHLARIAARFFDHAEIIELHHHEKADAPSGTALATAKAMVEGRGKPFSYPVTKKESLGGTRGGQIDGVTIHSIRLPGIMASQEVILGGLGQTLSLRHDTISRDCYLPGIVLAIKKVVECKGLVYGLDTLLELKEKP